MPELRPRPQFRTLVDALGRRALVGAIAGTLCIGRSGAANEDEERTLPPYHPYLAPALSLEEMARGDLVERAMERSARILFPELAQGTLPATDFGALSLPTPRVVLFRQTGDGTLVEMREKEHGVYLRDLTDDETPPIATKSRPLHPEIATASVSAIRRALTNARPNRPMIDGDVERVVLGGVSHYFFSGDRVGSAHSPDSATEAGMLVRLVRVLGQFVDGEAAEGELRMAAEDALRANHGMTKDR
ncbi:MAG: hypothetical protein OXH68_06770 [Gammaproteobacteria bacterium]|nr:hypothetical protein [Gammaproteobacteria bacterium]